MHPDVTSKKHGKCPKCGMNLRAVSVAAKPPAPVSGSDAAATSNTELKTSGMRIPDTTVYDQNGQKRKFYTDLVKGKTVAINFIFTTCTTICPPLTATFRRVQQELGERVGRDIELISISVDPTTDVPERLKAFSAKFKAGAGWSFVTGDKMEIDELLKALGASVPDDKNNHTSMILIGNDSAKHWTRTYGLAPAATLVKAINEVAAGSAGATNASSAVAEVPLPGSSKADNATASERVVTATAASAPSYASSTKQAEVASRQKKLAESAANYFPNIVLINQDNKPMRFYDDLLKGKTVMINFMLTHCQGACSPMTANLAKVQKYLGERMNRDVLMISISVDPANDTPAALKKYAESFKAQPGWYFLTGKKEDVEQVLRKVGGYTENPQQHSLVLIIGDEATGQWLKAPAMAKPTELVDAVTKMLTLKKDAASVRQ